MTDPRFSIITVTKNNLSGLHRTAQSIKQQTCVDYEWLVIDGASTDETLAHYSPAISEPDNGIYDAMNKGLVRSRGNYILFMNAGDSLAAPDVLEKLAAYDADFIYGDAREDGYLKRAKHTISHGMITHHQSMLYRRKAISDLRFNPAYPIAADYDFTWRFMRNNSHHIHVPVIICDFESGGLSQRNAGQGRKEQFMIRRKMGIPLSVCAMMYLKQRIVQEIRRRAPALFWHVRSRRNSALSPTHNQNLPRHP